MSNVVINVIPKPISPGRVSTGKHSEWSPPLDVFLHTSTPLPHIAVGFDEAVRLPRGLLCGQL